MIVYCRHILYFTFNLCTNMRWRKTLAFCSKAENYIKVIIIFNHWNIYNVIFVTIWCKLVISTICIHRTSSSICTEF